MISRKPNKLKNAHAVVLSCLLVLILATYGLIFMNTYSLQTSQIKGYVESSYKNDSLKPVGKNVTEDSVVAKLREEDGSKTAQTIAATPQQKNYVTIPTLLYHKTPADFEQQLVALRDRGYTTITMNEFYDIVRGKAVSPAKPVAITFDDGFTDQLNAFSLLKKYNMKATFYIITGGELSNWCIGADRNNFSCGDDYMNWGQIKGLYDSGLIEIGAHTIDHLSLPNQLPNVQRDEIFKSKSIIEEKLGIKVNSFAYPYGRYNAQLIDLVRQAGFTNAAGTEDGMNMSLGNIYNIPRIRTTLKLP